MSGIGRDVGRLAGLEQDRREVADTHLHRALEDPEALLEAVTVWRRSTARRDEHVQHREPASSLLAGEPHGVIVATSLLCRPLPGTGDWDGLARRQIELMINGLGPTAPLGSGLPS